MKILWLSHFLPYPPKAGVLIRGHYMVKELAKYHDVDLLAFNQRALIEPYFIDYEEGTRLASAELGKFCGDVITVDCPVDRSRAARYRCALRSLISRYPYTINWLESSEFEHHLKTQLRKKNYDLVHFDTISLAPYRDLVNNIATTLDHHNVESHMLLRRAQLESNPLKKLYFWQEGKRLERLEKQFCPLFDLNITCSDLDTERFREFIPKADYVCIPNGVDIERFKPSTKEPDPARLIFIGTLDWYPNTRAAMYLAQEIWPKLKAQLPQASADIIGANPPAELVEFSRANPDFRVHGFVDDLNEHLEKASVYVCPIDDGGGTKLKILDALAAGKAIVANPIACEGIRCTNGTDVLFATSPTEYVTQIDRLAKNSALRQSIERAARQLAVTGYSYEIIGNTLSDALLALPAPNQSTEEHSPASRESIGSVT